MTSNCTQRHRAEMMLVPPSLLAISGAASADPGKTWLTGINCGGLASSKAGEEHRAHHRISGAGAPWPEDPNDSEEFPPDERRHTNQLVASGADPLRFREQDGT